MHMIINKEIDKLPRKAVSLLVKLNQAVLKPNGLPRYHVPANLVDELINLIASDPDLAVRTLELTKECRITAPMGRPRKVDNE